jgi:serine/threonine protein kinase
MISLSNRNHWNNDESDEPLAMRNLTDTQKDKLGTLLEKYMTALESGMPPSVGSLTRSCPELRDALQACVEGLEGLHRMAAGESTVEALSTHDPRRLGDFELHKEIGRGGMGVVYRATQTSLHRTVAIKLLPLTSVLDSRQLTRFQHEAEAAASLQHPNIVPVYAVGCERGIHFYAMQFIQGSAMGAATVEARDVRESNSDSSQVSATSDWRTAVAQAAQVADGLHAAHKLGVIHRDIKPSNLIVDHNGKPWITDFGLARIQSNVSLTQSGDVIGTMRYMSPEQSRGESAIVDGRTDVYSLGTTLYEMLAGTPAHDGEDARSILRQIEEDVVPLRRHCPGLPRDLETVVAKAMATHRDGRYETAHDFASDLRRVLADEPTVARPPTWLDRSVRLATKFRATVAAATVVGVLALAGFAISNARLAAANRLSNSRASLAKDNEDIAREAIDNLGTQMAELLGDIPAANSVRHRLLTETLDYYQRLATNTDLLGTPNHDRQLDLANIHGKIGSFQSELGMRADARRSLEESQRRYETIAEKFPEDAALLLQWSISQNNLAEALADSGDFVSAAEWFAKAIALQNRLNTDSDEIVITELATTLNNLGRMLTDSENASEAEIVFQRAINLLGNSLAHGNLRSIIQSNLAGLLVRRDNIRATEIARQSLVAQLEQLEADPSDAKAATRVVLTLNTLASAQAGQSQHQEAIESLRSAIDISEQMRSRWPDQGSYRRDLGISLNQLGLSLSAIGQTDRAADAFERSSQQARELLKAYGDDAQLHSMLGSTLNNLAFLKKQLGDYLTARSLYTEAIEHQRHAVKLAPQVPRYQVYLSKHEHNLQNLRGDS